MRGDNKLRQALESRRLINLPPDTRQTAYVPVVPNTYAKVSAQDKQLVANTFWRLRKGYAVASHGLPMHRVILEEKLGRALVPADELTEHRNHDALDNRRSNLRVATGTQNQANRTKSKGKTSKYKGVSYSGHVLLRPWKACIKYERNQYSLETSPIKFRQLMPMTSSR